MINELENDVEVKSVLQADEGTTQSPSADEDAVSASAPVPAAAEGASEPENTEDEETSVSDSVQTENINDVYVNMEHLRMVEALLFAAEEPLDAEMLASSLPEGADIPGLLAMLERVYEKRGVNLIRVAGKWQFRTAPDLAFLLRKEKPEQKKLSRAAIETLAIIAYHQPVTRAEIEDIRGVAVSKGTLDTLIEISWVKIRGRKRTPGRPVTYGTTDAFLIQFGLENIGLLPGMDELKAAGFLEAIPPSGFDMPEPSEELAEDEDPYEGEEEGDAEEDEMSEADLLEPPI